MQLYIDPGTGSMLFTILIGVLGAAVYGLRSLFIKLRLLISGGAGEKADKDKIPIAIFTDSKRYWNVFEPICDEFEKRGQDVVYMTASPDDPALNKKYSHIRCRFIGEGNKPYAKLNMLKADMVISSTPGLDVYQWKRSKDVKWYGHVLHAPNDSTAYRMFGLDYYDSVMLCGSYQIDQLRQLEKIRNLPAKELPVVGLTYLDGLKKRLETAPGLPPHETTVLLAPSWGISSIFNRYGEKIIDALLETGYHIIVRPHPQSKISEKEMLSRLMGKYPDSDRLEWNSDNDNFHVLQRSDILISDYSGVMFDFSLVFDKPVLYADTSFDKSPLDAWWLEEEMWTFRALPKIGRQLSPRDLPNIKELIDSCLRDNRYAEGRAQARKETWAYIGESPVRTVNYLMDTYRKLQDAPSVSPGTKAAVAKKAKSARIPQPEKV